MKAKFSKTICLMLAFVMMLAVGSFSVSAATDIVPTITFDSSVGGFSGQGKHTTETLQVVADPAGSSNTVLEYYATTDGSAKNRTGINYKFSQTQTETVIEQQFDYYTGKMNETSTAGRLFIYADSNSKDVQLFQLYQNKGSALIQYTYEDSFDSLDKNSWYTFKIVIDTIENEKYLFYKKTTDATWTDMTAAIDLCTTEITSLDGIFIGNTSLKTLKFYVDNYSAKSTTMDEVYVGMMKGVNLAAHNKSLTVEAGVPSSQILQSNVPASPGSGVTVYSFSLTIPEENLGSGAARMCIIGSDGKSKPIFNILPDGRIRLALGAQSETYKPYADLRSAGKGTVDFKVILYTDTGCYDVLYKESIDATYTSICTMAYERGWDEEKQYGKYYASAGTLNAPKGLQLNCWYGNATTANEEYTVNLSNITMVSYPDADDMLSDPALFGAYYNALKEEKVVDGTFSAATDAAALSLIDAENITGNANILFAATNMTNVAAVKNTEYANYASAAATVNAADEEVSALIDFGVYTEDSATAKKVRLLKSLQECTGSKAAGINTYFNADSTILNADAVTVGGAGILMIAAYNVDNELISITDFVDLTALTEGNVSLTIPSGATTLKAFVWDSMDNITPLHSCDVVELAVVEE